MSFIQENIINININIKNEYKIIHFSDVHAITYNENDPKEEIELAIKNENAWLKTRKEFADYFKENCTEQQMIPTKDCLDNIINYINEEKPIGVVMTGDIIDYYSQSNLDYLMESCGRLNYPFVFCCGNHETPVSHYEDITYNKDGFMVLEFNDFKIIGVDDSTKEISLGTLKQLKQELRSKKKCIVAMHIPIITNTNREQMSKYSSYFAIDYELCNKTTKEFIDLLINNESVVAILAGHVHGQGKSMFAPNKIQYCASSGLIGYVNKLIIK